jgi:membrane protease YdiL (CAAX protease family)
MNTQPTPQNHKHTLRNLLIFNFATLTAGWIGLWLDRQMGVAPGQQGLGMLLWLVAPLATDLLLRAFGGDGWATAGFKPAFRKNLKWYAASLLIYPITIGIALLFGMALGAITVPANAPGLFLQAFAMAFVSSFFKNLFEEFAWRGYLAPQLFTLRMNPFLTHALVGIIWTSWHLPYWFGFLDAATVASFSPYSLPVFALISYPTLIAASLVYGELQMLTKSVWPAVLIHTMSNALLTPLILGNFITVDSQWAFFVSPGMESLFTITLFILIGVVLVRIRVRQES